MRKLKLSAGAVLCLVSALFGCSRTPPGERAKSEFTYTTDLIVIANEGQKKVFWYDNQTVIFAGIEPSEKLYPPNIGKKARIYIWRPPAKPEPYPAVGWSLSSSSYLCAGQGQISYAVGPDTQRPSTAKLPGFRVRPIASGQLGHETHTTIRIGNNRRNLGPFDLCGDKGDAPAGLENFWVTTYDRRYAFDLGPTDNLLLKYRGDAALINISSGQRYLVPLSSEANGTRCAQPAGWDDSFLVWDCATYSYDYSKRHPSGIPLIKVKSDGKIEKIEIKYPGFLYHSSVGVIRAVFDTRRGIFFTANILSNSGNLASPFSGLYKFSDGKTKQIIKGYLELAAVSPDGCQVAFYDWTRNGTITALNPRLAIKNVC